MKRSKKTAIYVFALIIISVVIPIAINELYKLNKGYETQWGAADTLAFYGAIVGAIGTIVLGIVSWQQNARLVRLEENSFIAQNACSAVIKEVKFKGFTELAVGVDQHEEQILTSNENLSFPNCASLEINYKLKALEGVPSLINVSYTSLVVDSKDRPAFIIELSNNNTSYSRVAISEENSFFKTTIFVAKNQKDEFINAINNSYGELMIETHMSIVTDKYVVTKLRCRSKMNCNGLSEDEDEINNWYISEPQKTLCFWYGNEIVNKEEVEIKTRLNEL